MTRRWLPVLVALFAVLLLDGCSKKETPDELMKSGVDLLYTKKDANAAAAKFRKVLDGNPDHYGATFQLATALDRSGRRSEATPYWEKMLGMARSIARRANREHRPHPPGPAVDQARRHADAERPGRPVQEERSQGGGGRTFARCSS